MAATLRFFVQPRDSVSFDQIADLYRYLPVSAEEREHVTQAAATLSSFLEEIPDIAFVIEKEKLSNRRLFDIFMHGSLVHANPDRQPQYKNWIESSPPFVRVMYETCFEEIVAELIRAAGWFHGVNERALEKLQSMDDSIELEKS